MKTMSWVEWGGFFVLLGALGAFWEYWLKEKLRAAFLQVKETFIAQQVAMLKVKKQELVGRGYQVIVVRGVYYGEGRFGSVGRAVLGVRHDIADFYCIEYDRKGVVIVEIQGKIDEVVRQAIYTGRRHDRDVRIGRGYLAIKSLKLRLHSGHMVTLWNMGMGDRFIHLYDQDWASVVEPIREVLGDRFADAD